MSPMQTQKYFPVALLVIGLAHGLGIGIARAEGVPPAAGNIQSLSLAVSPLIPKDARGEHNLLVAAIDSAGLTNATLTLASPTWPQPIKHTIRSLSKGKQPVEVEVAPLTGATAVTVSVELDGRSREFGPFTVAPPRKWTMYLTQHTHTDIGYTRPQTEILPEHLRYIDYALDYCDLTDSLPDDARFRWTCETSWAVRQYLSTRPTAQIARLKQRVREGRIEITGMLINMSELATENSLAALVRPVRAITEEFGIPVRTAMQDDVNGAGWCLADYLNGIGIRYLNMGINKTRSLLPFDKPTCFWWESPSGKRVLAYRSDHYMTANFWGVEKGDASLIQPKVVEYLTSLEEHQYPFDRVGVQFSGYFTDNSPPSTIACNLVKVWNEKYAWPHLRLSTTQEFLAWVEKEHGSKLEVHRQAWPDWWTDGFGSARATASSATRRSIPRPSTGRPAQGGFDVVVGNPPYIRQELLSPLKPWLEAHYEVFHGMADLYVYFYELGVRMLKPGGLLCFIVTNKWMKAGYGEPLRRFFSEKAWVRSVVDFGHAKQIFEEVDVFPSIILVEKPTEAPPRTTAH
jgi:hypothetical protein